MYGNTAADSLVAAYFPIPPSSEYVWISWNICASVFHLDHTVHDIGQRMVNSEIPDGSPTESAKRMVIKTEIFPNDFSVYEVITKYITNIMHKLQRAICMKLMEFDVKSANKVQKSVGMEKPRELVPLLRFQSWSWVIFWMIRFPIEHNRYHLKWFHDNHEDCGRFIWSTYHLQAVTQRVLS